MQTYKWQLRPGDSSFMDTVGVPIRDIRIADYQEHGQYDSVNDRDEEGRDNPVDCSSLAVPEICKGHPAEKDAFH